MIKTLVRGLLALVLFALVFQPGSAQSALNCAAIEAYQDDLVEIMLDIDGLPEVIDGNLDFTTMSKRQLREAAKVLGEFADALADYKPAPGMKPYHLAFTAMFLVLSNIYADVEAYGMLFAALFYADLLEETTDNLNEQGERLNKACPGADMTIGEED